MLFSSRGMTVMRVVALLLSGSAACRRRAAARVLEIRESTPDVFVEEIENVASAQENGIGVACARDFVVLIGHPQRLHLVHQSAPVRLAVREWKLAAPLGQGGRGDPDDKKQHDQWVEEPVGLSSHICSTSLCSCCPVSFCHCLRIAFKPMKDHPIWRPIFGPQEIAIPFATPNKLPRENFSGVLIDERKAEARSPLAKLSEVARPLVGLVRMLAWILVDEVAFEDVIHEHRELPGGGGDGVWLAQAGREPTIKRAERGGRAAERRGRQSKRVRGPIRGGLGLRAEEPP